MAGYSKETMEKMEAGIGSDEAVSLCSLIDRLADAASLVERMPELCMSILNMVIEFTPCENASIMLTNSGTGALDLFCAKGRSDNGAFFGNARLSPLSFALGEGAAGWVAEQARPIVINDCEDDARFIRLPSSRKGVNSIICAPLLVEQSVIGVLNCSHPDKQRFGPADKRAVAMIARHASVLIRTAMAIDRMRGERRRWEEQAESAKQRIAQLDHTLGEMREQLYRTQKFASLGELLAGAAHELNNRIAPILIYSQMLRRHVTDEKDQKRLGVVEDSAIGAKTILQTLLNYSRTEKSEKEPVDLNQILLNTVTLVEYKMRNRGIELSLELCSDLPSVSANEKQIAQVLLNLINNAIHAMEEKGGKLYVRTTCDRQNVKLTISDSGAGIPEEILDKIFDPFFTTKESGKGTGLGLSISKRYVDEHGGRIYIESTNNAGATFVVELPSTPAETNASASRLEQAPKESNGEDGAARILVVDDDATIRNVIRDVLGSAYDVEFAENGNEATQKIQGDVFDLLVVDYHMPGLDGKQLYEWVADHRPVMKNRIVFSTGDICRDEIRDFIESTGCICLLKPFSTADLRKVVSAGIHTEGAGLRI